MAQSIEELPAGPTSTTGEVVLRVDDLRVGFAGKRSVVEVVRGVSFELHRGEVLGIVGESGSGKSVTSTSIMGLHGDNARVRGSIDLHGTELIGATEATMRRIRGNRIAMIFQDPMTSLDPVQPIGKQVAEAVLVHSRVSQAEARERAAELLTVVGIPRAKERLGSYPHEFSGGMRQRVVIAIAMANDPEIIIADEPTTALDVTVQAQVLDALERAREYLGASLILVTHDLGVVAGRADRVLVMYAGRVVESGRVDEIFYSSRMPYSRGLMAAIPRLDQRSLRLVPIPGTPPRPSSLDGHFCPFVDRCDFASDICRSTEPELISIGGSSTHRAACHFATDYTVVPVTNADVRVDDKEAPGGFDRDNPVLAVRDLTKEYTTHSRGRTSVVKAVNGVSFELARGETLGLVGESGCGKSSVGRSIVRLQSLTSGEVVLKGENIAEASGAKLRAVRRDLQMVFQDPYSSLDPRMSVGQILDEPLRLSGVRRSERPARIQELLLGVGLSPEVAERYPHEFSGGQRQRIGIARALATDPSVLVLDEPVSALDVSVQAGVINLLADLVAERGLSSVFIAHDLAVVAHVADRIAVMYLGRIVELGSSSAIFSQPRHPYTKALVSAVPIPDPEQERARERITLTGDLPSPTEEIRGCAFRTRCPLYSILPKDRRVVCEEQQPSLAGPEGHTAACHHA